MTKRVEEIELYAWLGLDEFGSGEIGLKRGLTPAGDIPMVAISREKLEKFWPQAEALAAMHGKRIYMVRFKVAEVVRGTKEGE